MARFNAGKWVSDDGHFEWDGATWRPVTTPTSRPSAQGETPVLETFFARMLSGSSLAELTLRASTYGIPIFILIAVFEQVPLIGFAGFFMSIGAWVYLSSLPVTHGRHILERVPNPSVAVMGWSALLGWATGLVGAVASLFALVGFEYLSTGGTFTDPFIFFGGYGAVFGVFYWPFVGAVICSSCGMLWALRVRTSH
jgi:hypothetical protein